MAREENVTVVAVPPLARTASGTSPQIPGLAGTRTARLHLVVTAVSGVTPTLDAVVEDSPDGTNWTTVGTFAQVVTPSTVGLNLTTPTTDRLRVRWTLGGTTPSFTFAVHITAQD